jgi:hypothetical protein
MNHAFGIEGRTPVIQFNSLQTDAEREEQRGLMFLYKGIVGAIRRRTAIGSSMIQTVRMNILRWRAC